MIHIRFLLAALLNLTWCVAYTQASQSPAREHFERELQKCRDVKWREDLRVFYTYADFQLCWIGNDRLILQLNNYVKNAAELGLRKEDYHYQAISDYAAMNISAASDDDLLDADIRFTDAAIHFFRDISFGTQPPEFRYSGFSYVPDAGKLIKQIFESVSGHTFQYLLAATEHCSPEYLALKKQLAVFNSIQNDCYISGTALVSSKLNNKNKILLEKLQQLGIIAAGDTLPDKALAASVARAQRLFYLPESGKLNAALIEQLNVPLIDRIAAVEKAINQLRWLDAIRQQWPYIAVVNIPSASLSVYAGNNMVLESKLIVGKYSTPTPTLSSTIKEIILYPYWFVPHKIATRELLPLIKKDKNYLSANNFQVLNTRGRVLDPVAIDWQQLSTQYFPYLLRQSTGCDNSLGIIKINFYSPFDVYLHDTPGKTLFNFNRRYFSHGCMRLQKATEFAHLLLRDRQAAMDTIISRGCIKNQAPVVMPVSTAMPIFILYNTAWVDASFTPGFYYDVYRKTIAGRRWR